MVTWVLNASSKYEISSREHLLQLMNRGTLYTDAGTPPADYLNGDYEQTVDIDLAADANIKPIGDHSDFFQGSYDGSNYAISNFSFDGVANSVDYVGLFGYVDGGELQNLRLTGVWDMTSDLDCGSAVGFVKQSQVRNIECDFEVGTTVGYVGRNFGAVIGYTFLCATFALTVKGTINMINTPSVDAASTKTCGGVVGKARGPGDNPGWRNAAVWTNGLSGEIVGGVLGYMQHHTNLYYAVNAMVGDITGATCGGITGFIEAAYFNQFYTGLVNSMVGSITGTDYAGGITGETYCEQNHHNVVGVMNYMTGDIVSTNNTSGGMCGHVRREGSLNCTISNSIVAMNGTVDEAVIGSATWTPTVSAKIDTAFGFAYTTATYGSTSDTFTGTTSTVFTDLAYIPLTFSDDVSNTYEYEMVFGNVGGSSSYAQYTHAIISKDDIAGPYFIDFDLMNDGTEYLTYLSVDSGSAYTDGSLIVLGSSAPTVYDYTGSTVLFPEPPLPFGNTDPGIIPSGVVMYVNANILESYEDGAAVMNDLSGSSTVFDFKVNTTPSLSGGGVDFTPLNNYLKLSGDLNVQTISLWFKKAYFDGTAFVELRDRQEDGVIGGEDAKILHGSLYGDFFTNGSVYLNGGISSMEDVRNSPDDQFINVVFVGAHLSADTRLTLFANFAFGFAYPTIFKSALFYDRALTAEEVLENYNTLLANPQAGFALVLPLAITPRALSVFVVVGAVDGATAYRITSQKAGSSNVKVVKNSFTHLEQTIKNLAAETEYTFRLYSTDGSGYNLVAASTVTTLANSAANYDKNDFADGGVFKFDGFDETSRESLSGVMNEIFTTGDEMELTVRNRTAKATFVNRGGSSNVERTGALLLPFTSTSGAGQTAFLDLSDSTTLEVAYDVDSNSVSVDSVSYQTGDHFVVDGVKCSVLEY